MAKERTQIGFKKQEKKQINISNVLVVRPPDRANVGIEKLKNALSSADRGRMHSLYNLYDELLRDPVLGNAVEKRITAITNADLLFQKEGKESDEMSEFIDTPEFEKLLQEIMLAKFYGKSVIELGFAPAFTAVSIKRQHLNTERKEIVRELYDDTGIPYENNDFLLNVGEEGNLGIFLRTAPYAIYKRNGWGDFAQFVELYGIDTLIGLYDPDDENGRQEMEKAMKNRGSAGSMTMNKNSDVKTIGTKSPGTVDIHDRFLDKCDNQILIAILGQTMTTKDGSSLSQSKTHAQTEDDINQADRRFVQRVLNTELLPRLEKRGYPVKGGKFYFAEKGENLSKEDELKIAERINQITGQVDENYWHENFGIPKGKKKEEKPNNEPPTERSRSAKKKKDKKEQKSLFAKLKAFFVKAPHSGATSVARLSNNITDINVKTLLRKALEEIYNGDTEIVNRFLFEISNETLQHALTLAFDEAGEEWKAENSDFINEFRYNTAVFAAFKNHQQTAEMVEQLTDENGELRSFRNFRKATKGIAKDYNEKWLQTEYNTAVRSARAAVKWRDFLKTEHLYPNLEYMQSRASHKREEHLEYVGTILPIRHSWWDTHLPPTDWNCKCWVRPTDKEPTAVPDAEAISGVFANNPGKTGEFVNIKATPYYLHTAEELRKKVEDVAKHYKRQLTLYTKYKDDENYQDIAWNKLTGGFKATHKEHHFDKKTGQYEKNVRDILYNNGHEVILESERSVAENVKIPDGTLNGRSMDISSILGSGKNAIKRALYHSKSKGVKQAILYFPNKATFSMERLHEGIAKYNGVEKYRFEKIIYIVENKAYEYKP